MSKGTVDCWTVPHGLVSIRTFSVYIMHFVENKHKGVAFFEKCPHVSLSKRSGKWQSRSYSMNEETLFTIDMSAQGIAVKNSTIPHPDARRGLIDCRTVTRARWSSTTMAIWGVLA